MWNIYDYKPIIILILVIEGVLVDRFTQMFQYMKRSIGIIVLIPVIEGELVDSFAQIFLEMYKSKGTIVLIQVI